MQSRCFFSNLPEDRWDVSQSRRAVQGTTDTKASKAPETTAIPEAPPPTPGSTKQKVIGLTKLAKVGIIKIANLTFREVGVCSPESRRVNRLSEGWAGEISPETKSLEVSAGVYKLQFDKHFLANITVAAGETIVLDQ
jgi:hypothetical protein